jgi:hypothetical protein
MQTYHVIAASQLVNNAVTMRTALNVSYTYIILNLKAEQHFILNRPLTKQIIFILYHAIISKEVW